MLYAAVFLLSLSSLAYEVLLPRIFAFTQWHHLAFLVISVVVFGFGAGGAAVSLSEGGTSGRGLAARVTDPSRPGALGALTLLFCLSAFGSLAFLLVVPLDYFRLPVEPRQAGFLALTWLLLLLPFLLAGAVQALAFAALPERSGWLYAAGMAGGACGALLPMVLLGRLGEVRLALCCLALPALPWILAPLKARARRLPGGLLAVAALAVAAARLLWPATPLRPSPYKLLAQAGQLSGTRQLSTENCLAGRVDWLDSPALRFVPGPEPGLPRRSAPARAGGARRRHPGPAFPSGAALRPELLPFHHGLRPVRLEGPVGRSPGAGAAGVRRLIPALRRGGRRGSDHRDGPPSGGGPAPAGAQSRPARGRRQSALLSGAHAGELRPGAAGELGRLGARGRQPEPGPPAHPGGLHRLPAAPFARRPVLGDPPHPAAAVGLPAPAGHGGRSPAAPGRRGALTAHRHAAQLGHLHSAGLPAAFQAAAAGAAAALLPRTQLRPAVPRRAARGGGQPLHYLRSAVPLPGAAAPGFRAGARRCVRLLPRVPAGGRPSHG